MDTAGGDAPAETMAKAVQVHIHMSPESRSELHQWVHEPMQALAETRRDRFRVRVVNGTLRDLDPDEHPE